MNDFQRNTRLDRPTFILKTKSLREILSDLRKAEVWLKVAALAAFLASAFFVVKYFVGGDMTPALWTKEQWANALLGLGITAVITSAQAFLYASGYKGQAALIATFIVVFFGLFSEISQSMEREDASVRHRSENSAVFKATLGSIQQLSTTPTLSGATTGELARAQQKAASIQTRIDNKNRCKSCEPESFRNLRKALANAKGRVAAAQARVDAETQANSTANAAALQKAISTAKALEYDEDKHYAMIRLIKQLFGVTDIWASFLFSVIIIGTFEYAFHFVGAYVADHKRALKMLGRDSRGRRINNDELETDLPPTPPGDRAPVPQDRTHDIHEEHPNRTNQSNDTAAGTQSTPTAENGASSFTKRRFFKLIYTEVRNQILNGKIEPTIRPVTDAVAAILEQKSKILGVKPSLIGTPQRQQIAHLVLQNLEQETVITQNKDRGIGKPHYVLAQRYQQALNDTHQPVSGANPGVVNASSKIQPAAQTVGNTALKIEPELQPTPIPVANTSEKNHMELEPTLPLESPRDYSPDLLSKPFKPKKVNLTKSSPNRPARPSGEVTKSSPRQPEKLTKKAHQRTPKSSPETSPVSPDNLTGEVPGQVSQLQVDNAISVLWRAIDSGGIKRSSINQCKKKLLEAGHATSSDVVSLNPEYDGNNPRGGKDKYRINKQRKIHYNPTITEDINHAR